MIAAAAFHPPSSCAYVVAIILVAIILICHFRFHDRPRFSISLRPDTTFISVFSANSEVENVGSFLWPLHI